MSKRLGATLTLLRRPGPTFQRTKLGEFDTGEREFLCLSSRADQYMANVFVPGATDFVTLALATGGELPGYRSMLVAGEATKKDIGGGETIITVAYAGLLRPKGGAVRYTSAMEQIAPTIFFEEQYLYIPAAINVPKPQVVHRWTTDRGRPNVIASGSTKNPPGISASETARLAQFYDDFIGTQTTVFEKWVLVNRTCVSPGEVQSSRVWQVVDVYEWTVVRVPSGL